MSKKENNIEPELNYKNIAKNPVRAFPIVFVYFFVIALFLGMYFVSQLDTISFNTIPGTALDTLNIVRDVQMKKGGIKPAVDLSILKTPSPELIAQGKKIFEAACASCHGTEGKGDGAASVALNPKPRNFHSKDGWTNGRTIYDIYKTVNNGVAGTGMTAYEYMSPSDRIAAILFIQTLTDFPQTTDELIAKLDAEFNLSKGVVEPNQIPVRLAVKKIENENKALRDKIIKYFDSKSISEMNGAKIFKQYSISPNEYFPVLISNFKSVKTVNNFIASISYSPEQYGFRDSIINLSSAEWASLFSYFKEITLAVFSG